MFTGARGTFPFTCLSFALMFSKKTLKNYLAPVLYLELVIADFDTDDENNDAGGDANQIPILNNNQDPKNGEANEDEIVIEDKSNEEADVEVVQAIPNSKYFHIDDV